MTLQNVLRLILLLSALAGVLPSTLPSIADFGFCADSWLMEDFNFTAYGGDWYTIMSIPNSFSIIRQCDVMSVQLKPDGSFTLLSMGLDEYLQPVRQRATLERGGREGEDTYLMLNSTDAPAVSYDIVSTDYHSYSCVYSCLSIASLRVELFWILTKELSSSEAVKSRCLEVFENMELDTSKLSEVMQGEESCRVVGIEEETKPEIKTTISPFAEIRRGDGGRESPRASDDEPYPEDKAPRDPSRPEEEVNKDNSKLKSESQSKKGFPHLLNEEEMEDAEYFVFNEEWVDINSAQTAAVRVFPVGVAVLALALRGLL